jgi:hypothetical protein
MAKPYSVGPYLRASILIGAHQSGKNRENPGKNGQFMGTTPKDIVRLVGLRKK